MEGSPYNYLELREILAFNATCDRDGGAPVIDALFRLCE